ncbi:MAG: hypothetical protein EA349_08295 [Halomonadaceae bacterium]|nr:MAG: hypothetical protein EA349_08295 [Halomonadaceae bacterium]
MALVLLLLHGHALAAPSETEQTRTLSIAYVEFAPFIYTDNKGNAAGTSRALSEQIATRAGFQLEWVSLPINRVVQYLARGHVDLWLGIAGQPHLQDIVIETEAELATVNLSAYHKRSQPPVTSLAELECKHLILISGYAYQGRLNEFLANPHSQHSRAPSHEAGLRMLVMGRGDYLLNYDEPLSQVLERLPVRAIERSHLSRKQGTFLVSRRAPGAQAIAQRLDQAFAAIQAEEAP